MEYGAIAGVDKPVARLVLGTMIISAREQERSNALLDAVFEQGGNAFDTAIVYAGGESERGLGAWMEARGNREQVVIISKGCHHNADRKRVTPFDLAADLHDSLARLRTDYVDVYLLHRDDPAVEVGPIVEAFNEHLAAGRVRAFGGSNWTHERIAAANAYAAARGLMGFAVSSPNYGLAEQVEDPWGPGCVSLSGPAAREARRWYAETRIPVLAYSSLARGFFSGRITRENFAETHATLDGACQRAYCHEVNFQRLERAAQLARERGVSVPQIATAFILGSEMDVFPLVGAASGEEFADTMRAFEVRLTTRERAWLDLEGADA
ncbi:MAG: aldo/keto reductase [Anaerolineales bacterium]|nr:aldo/keto reductase [Anaerolineales bacterium]